MLRQVLDWLQRAFSTTTSPPTTPPTSEQAQRTAATARHDRAGTITALRSEIRGLQQEIKDVSDSLDGLTGDARTADEGRLASLHRELEDKQRELGGLQARV
jgi:hypothetical protein